MSKKLQHSPFLEKCACASKACTCAESAHTPTKSKRSRTGTKKNKARIQVTANIGWGNVLFIRGEGASLSWDKGIALQNLDTDRWCWECDLRQPITFKLLINDVQWCEGENYTLTPKQTVTIAPTFT
ncbi:MAG: hypothetical protein LBH52_04755 [Puniceicoccales bacterium]|jgi:hypothetical protein|nr:hypothetical protein [Puniceicoccales bacterium]